MNDRRISRGRRWRGSSSSHPPTTRAGSVASPPIHRRYTAAAGRSNSIVVRRRRHRARRSSCRPTSILIAAGFVGLAGVGWSRPGERRALRHATRATLGGGCNDWRVTPTEGADAGLRVRRRRAGSEPHRLGHRRGPQRCRGRGRHVHACRSGPASSRRRSSPTASVLVSASRPVARSLVVHRRSQDN